MRRLVFPAITTALFLSALAIAHEEKPTKAKAEGAAPAKHEHKATAMTVQGEIVDLGCYLAHDGKGADHKSCALKCINAGMPMGVLTAEGTLYLLTLNHDNADPYNQAKALAAEMVEVTGPVHERSGMKMIDVTSVKSVKAIARPTGSK